MLLKYAFLKQINNLLLRPFATRVEICTVLQK